jgi:nucleoside-diphosphate-sugar epimerase
VNAGADQASTEPSFLAGRRVLVTGGFGFLGGHILEQILEMGPARVHVVDNLSSNPVDVQVLLEELPTSEVLSYDLSTVADYMASGPGDFDVIIHLASVVGPAGVLRHGGRIVSSIVDDTYLLADYALERSARLVDVSTSEVYGGGRDGLCREGDPKIVPAETSFRLEYAVGKLAAETALINLCAKDGLDVVIVRPFNIAGPRQSGEGGFVLPRFLAQAHLGLPLTIFGTGQARRAFSHVSDLADGVIRAAWKGRPGTAYNVGNHDNVVTVEGLADAVLEATGSSSPKAFLDPVSIYGDAFVEANDKFPEAGRAIHELGWRPAADVHQIVRDTWEYMRDATPETFARLAGRKVIEQLVEAQTRSRSTAAGSSA